LRRSKKIDECLGRERLIGKKRRGGYKDQVRVHLTQRHSRAGYKFGPRNKLVGLRLVEDRDVEFGIDVLADFVLDLSAAPVFDLQLVPDFFSNVGASSCSAACISVALMTLSSAAPAKPEKLASTNAAATSRTIAIFGTF